jgi:hypothetical protein
MGRKLQGKEKRISGIYGKTNYKISEKNDIRQKTEKKLYRTRTFVNAGKHP